MRGVDLDTQVIEAVESELDRLVERRAVEAADQERVEVAWGASVRLHHARRREANRIAWVAFHRGLARAHAAISAEHLDKADALAVAGPGPDS